MVHGRLSPAGKRRFYYLGADDTWRVEGRWSVDFAGRRLVLPLHRDFDFAWIAAIAFHGHDTEVSQLYETLMRGPRPPSVFFDVGASWGLHSLMLLAHGARVLSFEPNPACHRFFLDCCAANCLRPELHAVAVSDRSGVAELAVPGGETYLGTTATAVKDAWAGRTDVTTRAVAQVTLDQVAAECALAPDLIKIDVEGGELAVLAGAERVLSGARPLVVLESWPGSPQRPALFARLASHGYRLHALSFPGGPGRALTLSAYQESPALNFMARPAEADYPPGCRQLTR